jgi:RNA polymerase sigma factor (TIGR02999 family)
MHASAPPITALLLDWRGGDLAAFDRLFELVYQELRHIAQRCLYGERRGHTLNTTALVHEAYLKLVDINEVQWQDRAHFLAVAARAMRRILVSYARRHNAQKRGGRHANVPLSVVSTLADERAEDVLALNDALDRLGALNERLARTVELRFFGGLTINEAAEVLDVSRNTVKRDWAKAKAWLYHELHDAA